MQIRNIDILQNYQNISIEVHEEELVLADPINSRPEANKCL
jgi:hypothetical protein